MFEEILKLLPHGAGQTAAVVVTIGSLTGVAFYLLGTKFSRSLLTLMAVSAGTYIGMRLPLWFSWPIDGMGPGIIGAFLLGVTAYMLPRLFVGIWLGTILAAWACLFVWTTVGHPANWQLPVFAPALSLPQYLWGVWTILPVDVQRYMPFMAGVGMVSGIVVTLMWPRVGTVLAWSAAGVSILAVMGALTASQLSPSALRRLPLAAPSQAMIFCGLIFLGAIWQWRLIPKPQGAGEGKADKKTKKDD